MEIIKNGKVAVTFFITGILFLFAGLLVKNNIPDNVNRYFYANLIIICGVVMGLVGGMEGLRCFFYNPAKGKYADKAKQKAEKEDKKQIKEQLFKSMSKYDGAQQSFRYLSDDTLLLLWDYFTKKKYKNIEYLALENELMKRGLITCTPMYDRAYSLKREVFVE